MFKNPLFNSSVLLEKTNPLKPIGVKAEFFLFNIIDTNGFYLIDTNGDNLVSLERG